MYTNFPSLNLKAENSFMRRKMFLAAVAVCAGISSGFMMTESGSVFPAAAGACILALLVIGADLPRFSAALFVAGIIVFFMSYSFYESGGLSACEGQETEIVSKVKPWR